MKGLLMLTLVVIMTLGLILTGCGSGTTTNAPATTTPPQVTATTSAPPPAATSGPAPTAPAPAATTPMATASGQPKYGGTMIIIQNLISSEIGSQPEMDTNASPISTIYVEPLAILNNQTSVLTPALATSWDEDPANKTLTAHLRKGVKFHDNTDFNADAVKWNWQTMIDGHKASKNLKSVDVIDDYTVRFSLTDYPYNTVIDMLNGVLMYSPTASKTHDKNWTFTHAVGTGPFMVTDFQQDVAITMKKFDNYWGKSLGYPYLDGIILKRMPDPVTAQATMESKQADQWAIIPNPSLAPDLAKKGFKVNGTGPVQLSLWYLYPDTKPNSIFNDIKVRQAVAAAIDIPSMVQLLGKGSYSALNQLVPKGLDGYAPDYKGIPYNPANARKLLADSGHPDGFNTSLTYSAENAEMSDACTMIQSYLSAVGIKVNIIPLTSAAYFPAIFGAGWDGLFFGFSGCGNDQACISSFNMWMGPNRSLPFLLRSWPTAVTDLLDKGLHTYDAAARKPIGQQLIAAATDQWNVIPLYGEPMVTINQPWVHDDHPKYGYGYSRTPYLMWMDPH
jgi:peptide/nickel transport system substrate-binding protein